MSSGFLDEPVAAGGSADADTVTCGVGGAGGGAAGAGAGAGAAAGGGAACTGDPPGGVSGGRSIALNCPVNRLNSALSSMAATTCHLPLFTITRITNAPSFVM